MLEIATSWVAVVMTASMAAKVTNTSLVVLVMTPFVAVVEVAPFMVAVVMSTAMAVKVTAAWWWCWSALYSWRWWSYDCHFHI